MNNIKNGIVLTLALSFTGSAFASGDCSSSVTSLKKIISIHSTRISKINTWLDNEVSTKLDDLGSSIRRGADSSEGDPAHVDLSTLYEMSDFLSGSASVARDQIDIISGFNDDLVTGFNKNIAEIEKCLNK